MSRRYTKIVNDLRGLKLNFRINDLDESLEVQMNDEWFLMDDTKKNIIEMELEELGYGVRGKKKPPLSSVWRAVSKLADSQRYNPIKQYFKGLDGKYTPMVPARPGAVQPEPYNIPAFCNAYLDNPDNMAGVWLFRWMVGCVARVFEQARNPMLVIVGGQRMGKSRLVSWLCPIPERFREGKLEPDSKDARLRLMDTFMQEVGELGSTTRRTDVEALKEHITKIHVHERVPFGKLPILKPAVCNFVGTVNYDGAGFLNDPTGSSRFLSFQIDKISFNYANDVDVNTLWAEAWWFYRKVKNSWELTTSEQKRQQQINMQFELVSALEDVIDQFLIITLEDSDYIPAIDIKNRLNPHYRTGNDTMFYRELAKVLYKKGCERKREPYRGKDQPHRWAWYGLKWQEVEK